VCAPPFMTTWRTRQEAEPARLRSAACFDDDGFGAAGTVSGFVPFRRLRCEGHVPGRPMTGPVRRRRTGLGR
jgi:hypothetical protein